MQTESDSRASSVPAARPVGTHLCLIYDDEAEREEVVARFVAAGLRGGERVAYLADGDAAVVPVWLREHGVDLPGPPQFTLAGTRAVYCPHGEFGVEPVFDFWRAFRAKAAAEGYADVRATGETSWSREVPGGDRIVEYEARLNDLLVELPVTLLCQYDVRRFDGATILDILRVHPAMLIGGQVVQNPYYLTPAQFLAAKRGA